MVQPSYPAEDTLGVTSQNTTLMSSYIKEPPNRVKARIKHLRRDVASKIRDGWVFHWQGKRPGPAAPNPPPPHSNLNSERASVSCNGADLSLMGDSSFDNGGHGSPVKDTVDPRLHYRRRSYSSSLNSTESSSEEPSSSSRRRRRRRSFRSTFKFEDPDSVLRTLADQARHDRRTRRHNLEEEMSWNRGLNHWMVQRDAWVGAVRGAKRRRGHSKHTRPAPPADLMAIEHEADTSEQDYDPMDIDWDPSYQTDVTPSEKPTPPVTSLLSEDDDDDDDDDEEENESYNNRRNNPHNENDAVYDETGHDSQGRDHYTRTVQGVSPLSSCESLIPIAPPLIPLAEATEIGISERAYPQIYSKVVLCGQTPAIPINLAHMTKALVQGWKADGTWPQQAGPTTTTSTTSIRPKEGNSHHAGEYTNGHHGLARRPTGAEQSVTHARVKHRKHSLRGSISGLGPLGGSVRRALGFGESAAAE
ncbi:MAG: hypothetical protein M1825_001106 [Sarcosagium campestre]|nr:MAG: hypothetical protein M1825_001106 [Sarcosagium campestre]